MVGGQVGACRCGQLRAALGRNWPVATGRFRRVRPVVVAVIFRLGNLLC